MTKKYFLANVNVSNFDECVDPNEDCTETLVYCWEPEPSDGQRDMTKVQAIVSLDEEEASRRKIKEVVREIWPDATNSDDIDVITEIDGPAILDYLPIENNRLFEGREEFHSALLRNVQEMKEDLEERELTEYEDCTNEE